MLRANILSPWYHLNSVKPLSSAQKFQCLISVTGDPGESYYGFSSLLQDGFGIRFAKARTSRLLSVASGILTISFHRIFMILFLINQMVIIGVAVRLLDLLVIKIGYGHVLTIKAYQW